VAALEEVHKEAARAHTTLLLRSNDIGNFNLELNLSHELEDDIFT